jgi:pyrimidine deaminase RibD-like protein
MLRHCLAEFLWCCYSISSTSAFTKPGYRIVTGASKLDLISSSKHIQRASPLLKKRTNVIRNNSQSSTQQETVDRAVDKVVPTKAKQRESPPLNGESPVIDVSIKAPEGIIQEKLNITETSESTEKDAWYMRMAIRMAESVGGERAPLSAFPNPTVGAVLVSANGVVIGRGHSDYKSEAIRSCILDAGLEVTPLSEWCMTWPSDPSLRNALANATLYVTLEPSAKRHGTALPSTTNLIRETGIPRVVIGCSHPVRELAAKGATALHAAGIQVTMIGGDMEEECKSLIKEYAGLQNNKLMCQARKHVDFFGRPLGFLHCSVVDSDNVEAFARHGNAFGTDFDGKNLGFRDFGSYEIAPPPEVSSI